MPALIGSRPSPAAWILMASAFGCSQEPIAGGGNGSGDAAALSSPYSVRMYGKGETAISGAWVEPEPFGPLILEPGEASSSSGSAANDGQGQYQGPIAYVVQDSNQEPPLVAVFGLAGTGAPELLDSLVIRDPDDLLENAFARAREASTKGSTAADNDAPPRKAAAAIALDLEGITAATDGVKLVPSRSGPFQLGREFWVVCEGKGRLVDGAAPKGKGSFRHPNLLIKLSPDRKTRDLNVTRVVELPKGLSQHQETRGLEGVALGLDGLVYVAFQRGWPAAGDPAGHARIGQFNPNTDEWAFAHYPIDPYPTDALDPSGETEAKDDAWVGLSELSLSPDGELFVLERDNQRGDLVKVQRVYAIDVEDVMFREQGPLAVLTKDLIYDLIDAGVNDPRYGAPIRKPEALGVLGRRELLLLPDDDGKRGTKKGTPFFVLRTR